jgi:hypothetical protein
VARLSGAWSGLVRRGGDESSPVWRDGVWHSIGIFMVYLPRLAFPID